jgi:hydroxymethylpyrimidine/phosphomethylpyrimidine kinase
MQASHGGALWRGEPSQLMPLLRRAGLATPNVPEASALTGRTIGSIADASDAAVALRHAGLSAVLLKGGHLAHREGDQTTEVTDLLATARGERRYTHPRLLGASASPRGTGCALATAIAIDLGAGHELEVAVERATVWLAERIRASVVADGERRLG